MRVILVATMLAFLSSCSRGNSDNQQQQALGEVSAKSSNASSSQTNDEVRSGPFGLAMGQPVNELKFADESEVDPTQARTLASVPKPMAELETYAVIAYPQTGICEIRTVSKNFDSDAYGNNVKSGMDSLAESLDAKYGKHRKASYCSSMGSCEFFQMGLKDGSQGYSYIWSKASGATLPADTSEVSLTAMPGDYNDTFYRLDYTSANRESCRKAEHAAKATAL